MARILRAGDVPNYLIVRATIGVDPATLAQRIEERVPHVTASTRRAFAASERAVVGDMSTGIVRGMIVVGFVIGVAVAALVAYSQTLTQLRDYGVLRALGLRARRALALLLVQVATMVVAGFALALLLVVLLSLLPARAVADASAHGSGGDVVEAALVAAAVALAAALVPLLRVVRVEPASVYRRAS